MPQRFLRPGIRTSETWNRTSFAAQGLYVSILTLVDDFGRYDGRAKLIHGECFALRDDVKPQQTAALLDELNRVGLIQLYEHEGKEYLQVLRWQERKRCDSSKFPDPPDISQHSAADGSETRPPSPSPSPVHHRHKPSPSVLTFPAGAGEEFEKAFGRWMEVRRGLGKKPKDWNVMFQEQIGWLWKQPPAHRLEILSASIRNGWQGLFPLNGSAPPKTSTTDLSQEVLDAIEVSQ